MLSATSCVCATSSRTKPARATGVGTSPQGTPTSAGTGDPSAQAARAVRAAAAKAGAHRSPRSSGGSARATPASRATRSACRTVATRCPSTSRTFHSAQAVGRSRSAGPTAAATVSAIVSASANSARTSSGAALPSHRHGQAEQPSRVVLEQGPERLRREPPGQAQQALVVVLRHLDVRGRADEVRRAVHRGVGPEQDPVGADLVDQPPDLLGPAPRGLEVQVGQLLGVARGPPPALRRPQKRVVEDERHLREPFGEPADRGRDRTGPVRCAP